MKTRVHYDYEEVIGRAMELWRDHHHKYQNLVSDYYELTVMKKFLGLKLNRLKESDIRDDYPRIEFLNAASEDEAFEFLGDLTPREILHLIGQIDVMVTQNHIYRELSNWVAESKYQINHHGVPKSKYAMVDPDSKLNTHRMYCQRTSRTDE